MKNTKKPTKQSFLREHLGILLLIAFFIILELIVLGQTVVLRWDEPVYLANARSHISDSHFTEDFRFPLLEYVIAALWLITGESVFYAQLLMITMSALTIVALYLLARLVLPTRYALGAATLLATSKLYIIWGVAVYNDIPSLLFLLLSAYYFLRYYQEQRTSLIFLSGLFTSLAFLMRFPAAIIAPIIILVLLNKKNYKALLWYALGNALILAPWLIHNLLVYAHPLWDLIAQQQAVNEYTSWQPTIVFYYYLLGATHIFLLLALTGVYAYYKQKKKSFKLGFILALALMQLFYYAYTVNLKLERYVLMLLPFIYIYSLYALKTGFDRLRTITVFKQRKKLYMIVVVLVLLVLTLLIIHVELTNIQTFNKHICRHNDAFANSITYVEEHVPEGELVLSNAWTWYGYFGNHRAGYLYSTRAKELVEQEPRVYIMTNNKVELIGELDFTGVNHEELERFTGDCDTELVLYKVWS